MIRCRITASILIACLIYILPNKTYSLPNDGSPVLDTLNLTKSNKVLKEVTIEAERGDLHLTEVPASATIIGKNILERESSRDIRDLSKYISNFYIQESGMILSTPIYMRGIGTVSGTPSIGLYVDGAPIFDKNSFVFDLYDITRVDVLKGPQSTLYGRNSINGLINIKTITPINRLIVNADLSAGNYGAHRGMAAITIPCSDNRFANKLAFNWSKRDGFFKNAYNGKKIADSQNFSVRYKSLFKKEEHSAMLGLEYTRTEDGGYAYHVLDSLKKQHYTVNYNAPSDYTRDILRAHINASFNKRGLKYSNVIAYTYNHDKLKVDADYTRYDVFSNRKTSKSNLISEEFNIGSDKDSKISWNAGAFLFYKSLANTYNADFGKDSHLMMPMQLESADYFNTTGTFGAAAYGHIKFSDLWKGGVISAGLRYGYERAQLEYHDNIETSSGWINDWQVLDEHSDFNDFTPKISILQKFSNSSLYLSISKGYKAGGYNIISNEMSSRIAELGYDSESLWNYEIGSRYISRNNKLSAEISAFYINWQNQQIFVMGMMGPNIRNAGDARNLGIDGNINWNLLDKQTEKNGHAIDFNLTAGYVHAEYYHNKNEKNIGNRIVMAPEFTLNTGIDYTTVFGHKRDMKIGLSTWVNGTGKQFFDEENTLEQSPYFIWNSEITFQKEKWILSLWGRNLLDKHYFCYEFKSPIGKKKPEYLNSGQSGAPATYGITLKLRFIKNN